MDEAERMMGKKMGDNRMDAVSNLAIAEALHRLADAVERSGR